MRRSRRSLFAVALWANALALGLLAAAVLAGRNSSGPGLDSLTLPGLLPIASGQNAQPIAGGAGLYLMPAQLASSVWGVYVMDVDRQSLMVYQFDASGKKLNFLAAREITSDRLLGNYNTFPNPHEIKNIADKERQNDRVPPPTNTPGTEAGNP